MGFGSVQGPIRPNFIPGCEAAYGREYMNLPPLAEIGLLGHPVGGKPAASGRWGRVSRQERRTPGPCSILPSVALLTGGRRWNFRLRYAMSGPTAGLTVAGEGASTSRPCKGVTHRPPGSSRLAGGSGRSQYIRSAPHSQYPSWPTALADLAEGPATEPWYPSRRPVRPLALTAPQQPLVAKLAMAETEGGRVLSKSVGSGP